MYTFENLNVQTFLNLVSNFIAEKLHNRSMYGEIFTPFPFVNCTYNECNILYHGVSENKYEIKAHGLFFNEQIREILKIIYQKAVINLT